MEEKFRISFRGTIKSSLGYSVFGSTRWTITYRDDSSYAEIRAEMINVKPYGYAVRAVDIPDDLSTPREEIMARLRRAFSAAGAVLQLEGV